MNAVSRRFIRNMLDFWVHSSYNTKLNTFIVFRIENLEWKMENYRSKKAKMRVNPVVFRRGYLKKQTQFSKGQNELKYCY